ncbi:MAG: hypothetical protein GXY36_06465 [Chloroflexi bacterium]|nr:hypothetical protein [Chloroflexota bacterium]
MEGPRLNRYSVSMWFLIPVMLFLLVFSNSLIFIYIEGDDAMSVAYHALGRNDSLQPPYQEYHVLMDKALSLLPADEEILLRAGIGLTSVAAVLMFFLMFRLALTWLAGYQLPAKWLFAMAVLLAIPEFFYLGLLYSPSVIAMCLILAAHLLIRATAPRLQMERSRHVVTWSAVSVVLFALGAAIRWDTVLYGGIIFVDLAFVTGEVRPASWKPSGKAMLVAGMWGCLAIAGWLIILVGLGEDPLTAVRTASLEHELGWRSSPTVIARSLAGMSSLLSPPTLIFGGLGFVVLLRKRSQLLLLIATGLILVFNWLPRGEPKLLFPLWPGILVCVMAGFSALWNQVRFPGAALAVRTGMLTLLLVPWFVGVQVTYGDTCWGPGFECQPFDREARGFNLSVDVAVGSAIPTPEGFRPLLGHAWALFGGERRSLAERYWGTWEETYAALATSDLPLVEEVSEGWSTIKLMQKGFIPHDPSSRLVKDSPIYVRRFMDSSGEEIRVIHLTLLDLTNPDDLASVLHAISERQVVVHLYPASLRKVYNVSPDSLTKISFTAAILDLEQLARDIGLEGYENLQALDPALSP